MTKALKIILVKDAVVDAQVRQNGRRQIGGRHRTVTVICFVVAIPPIETETGVFPGRDRRRVAEHLPAR